jgi:hypothetical protein
MNVITKFVVVMKFRIKIEQLDNGSYMASVDWGVADGGKIGTPGSVAYADNAHDAYKIYKARLEAIGHTVVGRFMHLAYEFDYKKM